MDTSDSTSIPDGYKKCTKCGEVKPATRECFSWRKNRNHWRSWCKQCLNSYARERNKANPEKYRNAVRRWRESHLELVRERDRISRAYYRETHLEQARENVRRWMKEHPEQERVRYQRRRALKRALPHTFTKRDWQRALEYFHGCCAYCDNPPSLFDRYSVLHQEHHIAQSRGGGYTPDNILPACQSCNLNKSDKDVHEWLIERFGKKQAKKKECEIKAYFGWCNDDQ